MLLGLRLKRIITLKLEVTWEKSGPENGEPVLPHGWTYSIRSFDEVHEPAMPTHHFD